VTAKELLDSGRLSEALKLVTEGVKANPGDLSQRTALFELLCLAGDLERAARQLDVLGHQDIQIDLAIAVYRKTIVCEQARRRLFADGTPPHFLTSATYAGLQLKALEFYRAQEYATALSMLEEAEAARPLVTGTLNGVEFDDFKDADDLLGPFLEAFIEDRYTWIPWQEIKSLQVDAPKNLRDMIWSRAEIEFHSGSVGAVMLPVLYVDSYKHADESIRLGRITAWRDDVEEFAVGLGQKVMYAGQQEYGILELRSVELNPCQPPA
jgi:type VI secretion system protein ImpE